MLGRGLFLTAKKWYFQINAVTLQTIFCKETSFFKG